MERSSVFLLALLAATTFATPHAPPQDEEEAQYSLIYLKQILRPSSSPDTLRYSTLPTEDKQQWVYARCVRLPKKLQIPIALSAYICHTQSQCDSFELNVPSALGLKADIAVIITAPYAKMLQDTLQLTYSGVSEEDYILDLNRLASFGVKVFLSSKRFIYLPPAEMTADIEIESEPMDEFDYHKIHVRHLLTPWEVYSPDLYPHREEEQQTLHCFTTGSHVSYKRLTYKCFVPDLPVLVRLNLPTGLTPRVIDAVIAPHYWTMVKHVLNNTYDDVIDDHYAQDIVNYNGVDVKVIAQGRVYVLPPAVFENGTQDNNSNTTQILLPEDTSPVFELPELEASNYKVLHLEDLLDPQEFAGVEANTTQKIAWCFVKLPTHYLSLQLSTFICTLPDESYQIVLDIPKDVAREHTVIAVILHATFSNMVDSAAHGKFIGIPRHDYANKCEKSGGIGVRVEDFNGRIIYLPVAVPSEIVDYNGTVNIPIVHNTYQILVNGSIVSENDTEEWYSGRCYKDVRTFTDDSSVYQPYTCLQDTKTVHYKLKVPKVFKPGNVIDMALSQTVCDVAEAAVSEGSYNGVDILFFLEDYLIANGFTPDREQALIFTVSLPPPELAEPEIDLHYKTLYLRKPLDLKPANTSSPDDISDGKVFRCLKNLGEETYLCHHRILPVEIHLKVARNLFLPDKIDIVVTSYYWDMVIDALSGTYEPIPIEPFLEELVKKSSIGVKVNTPQGLIALANADIEIRVEEVSRFDTEDLDEPTKVYFSNVATPPEDVSSSSSENKSEEVLRCFHTTTPAVKLPGWSSYTCYHHEKPINVNVDIPSWFVSEKRIDVVLSANCWEMVNNTWNGVQHGISENDYVNQLVHNNGMGLTVPIPGSTQQPVFLPPCSQQSNLK